MAIGDSDGVTVAVTVKGLGELRIPRERSQNLPKGSVALLVLRAERLYLGKAEDGPPPGSIALPAEIAAVDYQGQAARYFVSAGGHSLQAVNPIEHHPYRQGERVRAVIRGSDCALVPAEKAQQSGL